MKILEEIRMSNLVEWAKLELERIGDQNDSMQQSMNRDILQIVEMFSEQGHSGFSASYALNMITRLLDWKPITPLTGEDDEWCDVPKWDKDKNCQQNKRCSAVFRYNFDNSTAIYIDGKVFSDDGGKTWWNNRNSRVPVIFPYKIPDKPERIILEDGALDD
jgi:hypothetical protein